MEESTSKVVYAYTVSRHEDGMYTFEQVPVEGSDVKLNTIGIAKDIVELGKGLDRQLIKEEIEYSVLAKLMNMAKEDAEANPTDDLPTASTNN